MKKLILASCLSAALISGNFAFAATEVSRVESKVVVENPLAPAEQRIIRITAADGTVLRLDAPAPEIERIVTVTRNEPSRMMVFNGQVVDQAGTKVFKMDNWKESTSTTTTTSSDSSGNKSVTEKTETRSLNVP
jgi:hypothetical protein